MILIKVTSDSATDIVYLLLTEQFSVCVPTKAVSSPLRSDSGIQNSSIMGLHHTHHVASNVTLSFDIRRGENVEKAH